MNDNKAKTLNIITKISGGLGFIVGSASAWQLSTRFLDFIGNKPYVLYSNPEIKATIGLGVAMFLLSPEIVKMGIDKFSKTFPVKDNYGKIDQKATNEKMMDFFMCSGIGTATIGLLAGMIGVLALNKINPPLASTMNSNIETGIKISLTIMTAGMATGFGTMVEMLKQIRNKNNKT